MKKFYLFLMSAIFVSNTVKALTVDELLGCYEDVESETNAIHLRIEKDQLKLGETPELGKIVPYPGNLVLSLSKGPLFFLSHKEKNWTPVGQNSMQFFETTHVEVMKAFLAKIVTFTIDKDQHLVLHYVEIISAEGPSQQESRMSKTLKRTSCPW